MQPSVISNFSQLRTSAILIDNGSGISSDNGSYSRLRWYSDEEEEYFNLVEMAKNEVSAGKRLSLDDSVAAYRNGFPVPDPAKGQVWWVVAVGGPVPVMFGQINSSRPGVYCRIGSNRFLYFDKNIDDRSFYYAPTPEEIDLWQNPIQSFDPVI